MNLYPTNISESFWTDSREDLLERRKVHAVSQEFLRHLKRRSDEHQIYAFTLSSYQAYVRKEIGWYDIDARDRFIGDLFSLAIHRLSSICCPNYRRQIHESRRIITLGFIENFSKNSDQLVHPHIHAVVAVHHSWIDKFESCFHRNLCRDHYSLNPKVFTGNTLRTWEQRVESTRLQRLRSNLDFYNWLAYSSKQITNDFDGGTSFLHLGTQKTGGALCA